MQFDETAHLLLAFVVSIACARLVGRLFAVIGQPRVIGEVTAGILLGPSLLGWALPGPWEFVFSEATLSALDEIAGVALILFMFLGGLELRLTVIKEQWRAAISTSVFGILLPFGIGLALFPLLRPLAPQGVSSVASAMFLASAMSVTALPLLVRIVLETGIGSSRLGSLAIACASIDDLFAWALLAVSLAVAGSGTLSGAALTMLLAGAYIAFMLTVGRRALAWYVRRCDPEARGGVPLFVTLVLLMFTSSLVTEVIGIQEIFGAFIFGVIVPQDARVRERLVERVEPLVVGVFLPLFFVYVGLHTQLGLLSGPHMWMLAGLVTGGAVLGKYLGASLAGRWQGMLARDASTMGWLMNMRGLTELIFLNVGIEEGLVSPELFAIFVVMALATTALSSAMLAWTGKRPG